MASVCGQEGGKGSAMPREEESSEEKQAKGRRRHGSEANACADARASLNLQVPRTSIPWFVLQMPWTKY